MQNRDKILRYLSDLMLPEEKTEFEKELNKNSSLKEEFEKISSGLEKIKFTPEVDENYFNSLSVNFREKLSKRRKKKYFRLATATASFAVLLIFLLTYSANNNKKINVQYDDTLALIDASIDEYFDSEGFDNLAETFSLDDYVNSLEENISDDEIINYVNTEFSSLPDDAFIDNLPISEQDAETIYKELKNEQIF